MLYILFSYQKFGDSL